MSERHEICPASEFSPGERRIIEVEGLPHSIGVFNVDGTFHALANVCPHQLAPLCEGEITGETVSDKVDDYRRIREGEVIQCPWHGWKFNIEDGTSVFNPHELRTRTYEVAVEESAGAGNDEDVESGTVLEGEEPPVDTYSVEVEEEVVVLYV